MSDEQARIHRSHPFVTPEGGREPVRRFRGRLAAGVTVWTAGADEPAGLTVSSVMVAEGEPSLVIGLINDTTDLFEKIRATGTFVVHVLDTEHRRLAERFAGTFPSPGGLFHDLQWSPSEHGPALEEHADRAGCRVREVHDAGYQKVVVATIEAVSLGELDSPLVYFRGKYRRLD
jgi:flavin reductase (DIM6/NTAB) family NADH-FMN oxidoreductase RutF